MSMFQRRHYSVPGLNTASLPDLIFTVLFFFMLVTHMRQVTLKVKYKVPQGTELTRLTRKTAVSHVYIGQPLYRMAAESGGSVVQLNDKIVSPEEVTDYMLAEKERMEPEDISKMSVSIYADRNTKMQLITEIKQALREANVLNVNYSATLRSEKQ